MVSTVSSSRVGLQVLSTNRGIGKTAPVEAAESHSDVYESSRDLNSGLADSSIDLSVYIMDKQGEVKLKQYQPTGRHFSRYA